jgi:hypothetical protein
VHDRETGHFAEGHAWIHEWSSFYRWRPWWIVVSLLAAVASFGLALVSLILGAVAALVVFVLGLFVTPRVFERIQVHRQVE